MIELPIIPFATEKAFENWLKKNHTESTGIWLQFYKKGSGKPSINLNEAIDVALCYGWIDSQLKKYDEESWLHKFTPRRPKSIWSKRNRQQVEMLTKAKRMHLAGLKQVEAAKHDGRWEQAYDKPSEMEVPTDFLRELKNHKDAESFFKTLNKANTYAIAWRLQTAKKPQTRKKRMHDILDMLKNHRKFHE